MADDQGLYASEHEVAELRDEIRRLKNAQGQQKSNGNGGGEKGEKQDKEEQPEEAPTFQYNPRLQHMLSQLTNHFSSRTGPAHALQQAYGSIYRGLQQQASVLAYIDVIWVLGALCLLALVLLLFAKKTRPGTAAMAH